MIRYAPLLATASLLCATPVSAQTNQTRLDQLERLIEAQAARISELERRLSASEPIVETRSSPMINKANVQEEVVPEAILFDEVPRVELSGDLRLRQEFNRSDPSAPDRTRNALRARVAARYQASEALEIGARIATGDTDDPNSADITLSSFADDFEVSLDQAFVRFSHENLAIDAGKFPNPLRRTDLVWDGDVNPQGLALSYDKKLGRTTLDARALYFIIEESPLSDGSSMLGGQLGLTVPAGDLRLALTGSYYDYQLNSLSAADTGDFRGNRLTPAGRYLSDFDIAEATGTIEYLGLGNSWPVEIGFDYVRNLGAVDDEDTAYAISVSGGNLKGQGKLRLNYSYLYAETDAVFAGFSHDNIPLSTNYRLHALNADYVLSTHVILGVRYYKFRPLDGEHQFNWRDRVRLELLFPF